MYQRKMDRVDFDSYKADMLSAQVILTYMNRTRNKISL